MSTNVDVLIIGAGAAGMMCAIEAARRGALYCCLITLKNWRRNSHLWWWPLQLHQFIRQAGKLLIQQSAFLSLRFGSLHPPAFHYMA